MNKPKIRRHYAGGLLVAPRVCPALKVGPDRQVGFDAGREHRVAYADAHVRWRRPWRPWWARWIRGWVGRGVVAWRRRAGRVAWGRAGRWWRRWRGRLGRRWRPRPGTLRPGPSAPLMLAWFVDLWPVVRETTAGGRSESSATRDVARQLFAEHGTTTEAVQVIPALVCQAVLLGRDSVLGQRGQSHARRGFDHPRYLVACVDLRERQDDDDCEHPYERGDDPVAPGALVSRGGSLRSLTPRDHVGLSR